MLATPILAYNVQKRGEEKSCRQFAVGYFFQRLESLDYKISTVAELLEKFGLIISEEADNLSPLYNKALKSLTSFVGDGSSCPMSELPTVVEDWVVNLRLRDFTLNTTSAYLKAISGLYTRLIKNGEVPSTDVFKELRTKLKENGEYLWCAGLHRQDFERFRSFVRSEMAQAQSSGMEADIMLCSLLNGCLPISEIAAWKKQALPDMSQASKAVVDRTFKSSARQYLFRLGQGDRTPLQISRQVDSLIISMLSDHNIKTFDTASATLQSYWGYAAMLAGMKPHEVASALPAIPGGLPALILCRRGSIDDRLNNAVNEAAVNMFVVNPMRWYAMHLRTRVTYDDLMSRFSEDKNRKAIPEMFYPSREIAKRVGKKILFEDQPFIHNVVFFKSFYDDIFPMFNTIGDLAWCYKTAVGTGGTYAAISRQSFEEFQRAIGRFTPDFIATDKRDASLAKGDMVRLKGTGCDGLTGEIIKLESAGPDGIVSYLVKVCNRLTDNFTVHIDPRQVEKIVS